jgi:hypothetical protein
MSRPIRIANISGFYGDRLAAVQEMLAGPDPIDVLTGDYLAELTMFILWKARERDPRAGYAATFLRQMEGALGPCLERGIRVVTNAGGLNPAGLAEALTELADRLGLAPKIAYLEGDDVLPSLPDLLRDGHDLAHLDTKQPLEKAGITPVTANAYLGGFGIAEALRAGADIVVTPRVTDAALVVGPAAWWHGWSPTDLDCLAGSVVAGHVIECGPQATGGNYCFADQEISGLALPGFPIAEVSANGDSTITKQPGTGGAVTIGTVTAQLLYEIGEPSYANPDVIARFDAIELAQSGPDRVTITKNSGLAPSGQLKVAINYPAGWRNSMSLVLTGLDQDAKAQRAIVQLGQLLGGWDSFGNVDIRRVNSDVRITVQDPDRNKVGRRFSSAVTELALSSYAGAHTTTPPSDARQYAVYWPTLIPATAVEHTVVLPDGSRLVIPPVTPPASQPDTPSVSEPSTASVAAETDEPTCSAPLGLICGGRSGDKGGNANIGLWTRNREHYDWLARELSTERLKTLLPETADLAVERYELPNLLALNFVVVGLLGAGVAASVRPDAQAKGLAEELRAQRVEMPVRFLERPA